jgi:hypothetical protein
MRLESGAARPIYASGRAAGSNKIVANPARGAGRYEGE